MAKKLDIFERQKLRKCAEDLLSAKSEFIPEMSHDEAQQLFHEFRTYQIELELQNEELRRAQEELEESRSKYNDLYDFAPVGYLTVDPKGLISEANFTAAEMLGESRPNLLNQPLSRFIAKEDQDIYYRCRKMLLDSQLKRSWELRLKNASASPFIVQLEAVVRPELDGDEGQFRVTITDITDRKKIEKALLESIAKQQKLNSAVVQSSDMIVITDTQGTIEYVNPAFERTTGYSRSEVIGKNPRILKSGKQSDEFYRNLWTTVSRGQIWEGQICNRRKDGKLYTERLSIAPIRDDHGKIVNYVSVKRDITKYLHMSEQLQQAKKMESLGRLAGGVAHDINNMLSVILGYSELLMLKLDVKNPMFEDLSQIVFAGKRSREVIKQLLAFASKQIIQPQIININTTVEQTIKLLERLIGENITLNWLPGKQLWPISIDPSQMDQILTNLIINARDSIVGVGQISITTSSVTLDEKNSLEGTDFREGDFSVVSISDTGCGIESEDVKMIFEPFYTSKELGKGVGLGLATVYGIAKQNNGFIDVRSEVGKGTKFIIYFPKHMEEITGTTDDYVQVTRATGATVLLVEDEASTLMLIKKILEKIGYTVHSTNSPGRALELATQYGDQIDILISDVVMPEMNGRELADSIKSIQPEIKILFMSGYTSDIIASHGVLEEGDNFINKPFSIDNIAQAVGKAMEM